MAVAAQTFLELAEKRASKFWRTSTAPEERYQSRVRASRRRKVQCAVGRFNQETKEGWTRSRRRCV